MDPHAKVLARPSLSRGGTVQYGGGFAPVYSSYSYIQYVHTFRRSVRKVLGGNSGLWPPSLQRSTTVLVCASQAARPKVEEPRAKSQEPRACGGRRTSRSRRPAPGQPGVRGEERAGLRGGGVPDATESPRGERLAHFCVHFVCGGRSIYPCEETSLRGEGTALWGLDPNPPERKVCKPTMNAPVAKGLKIPRACLRQPPRPRPASSSPFRASRPAGRRGSAPPPTPPCSRLPRRRRAPPAMPCPVPGRAVQMGEREQSIERGAVSR